MKAAAEMTAAAEMKAAPEMKSAAEMTARSINDEDIEADRHNGSGGAFEATESQRDEE